MSVSDEKPILFSTPMVLAILVGRKAMTRRVVKHQPPSTSSFFHGWVLSSTEPKNEGCVAWGPNEQCTNHYCKIPYEVGDILWVRETWAQLDMDYKVVPGQFNIDDFNECPIVYKADYPNKQIIWRPSIFMPRSAARLFLKVKSIRVERLQEITEEDARREGCIYGMITGQCTAKGQFRDLWDSLNSKRGYDWNRNPWVWVIEFERVEA